MTLFNRIITISQASRNLGPCSAQPKTPIDCFGAAWAGLDTRIALNLNVKFLASKSRSQSAYRSGMYAGCIWAICLEVKSIVLVQEVVLRVRNIPICGSHSVVQSHLIPKRTLYSTLLTLCTLNLYIYIYMYIHIYTATCIYRALGKTCICTCISIYIRIICRISTS